MLKPLLVLAALASVAHADDAVTTYALIVGSNTGGPGQTELHYAEDDARRVGAVLTELGGYTPDSVDVLVHPTPDALRDRLAKLAVRVAADQAAGKQSRVFFYYSGHARAEAIDLGDSELPVVELRTRLLEIPATLTVVVLDACQSGAFSRIKGARPAADFSINSRQHLDAQGVAVLASSSGSELSQESEQLRGSYFTHHFLIGLRGAGDANHDGQVSLDEAYRYAYHQTLLATAETAVGGQHVSLEVELKGHGEVPLSYPRAATSAIELPAGLEGQALVEDKRAHVVVAETYKARGAALRIAVAPGDYEVVVRHGTTLSHCPVSGGMVDTDHCTDAPIVVATTKGERSRHMPAGIMEVGLVIGPERHDAYTSSLAGFGYTEDGLSPSTGVAVHMLIEAHRHLWVGLLVSDVTMPSWSHAVTGEPLKDKLDWSTSTFLATARGVLGKGRVTGYGEIGAGAGRGDTQLHAADGGTYTDSSWGPAFSLGLGAHVTIWDDYGISTGYELDYAPVVKDLIGNTHAAGGHRWTLSLTMAL
jgi:hypothetical protein